MKAGAGSTFCCFSLSVSSFSFCLVKGFYDQGINSVFVYPQYSLRLQILKHIWGLLLSSLSRYIFTSNPQPSIALQFNLSTSSALEAFLSFFRSLVLSFLRSLSLSLSLSHSYLSLTPLSHTHTPLSLTPLSLSHTHTPLSLSPLSRTPS